MIAIEKGVTVKLFPLLLLSLFGLLVVFVAELLYFPAETYLAFVPDAADLPADTLASLDLSVLSGGLGDQRYIALLRTLFDESLLLKVHVNGLLSLVLLQSRLVSAGIETIFLLLMLTAALIDAFFVRKAISDSVSGFSPNLYSASLAAALVTTFVIVAVLGAPIEEALADAQFLFGLEILFLWTAIRHFHRF